MISKASITTGLISPIGTVFSNEKRNTSCTPALAFSTSPLCLKIISMLSYISLSKSKSSPSGIPAAAGYHLPRSLYSKTLPSGLIMVFLIQLFQHLLLKRLHFLFLLPGIFFDQAEYDIGQQDTDGQRQESRDIFSLVLREIKKLHHS